MPSLRRSGRGAFSQQVKTKGKFFNQMALAERVASSGAAALATRYVRPTPRSYTEACEAPVAAWNGAIPLRAVRKADQSVVVEKLYHHPSEVRPIDLGFSTVNQMYCMSNDDLRLTFPEGVGGKVMQMFPPGHPRGFLYRKESHLLNQYIAKLPFWEAKRSVLRSLTNGRAGFVLDGPTGTGKSALVCQAVHFARSRGVLTVYVPNAKAWTHGEWCWPSTILPGFFDAPDAARAFLRYFSSAHVKALQQWPLRKTPRDLPVEANEPSPKTLLDLCQWGYRAEAPASVDRQSVAVKYLMDELLEEQKIPILFVVDGYNLFASDTHFRYPHPDFWKTMASLNETDIDLFPQELPRIPASRLNFVRGLNSILLADSPNKFFITATSRDFKPFDGGVSGFPDVETDRHKNSLDEYAPFHAEKDTLLHPIAVGDFDAFEYRAYLRFLINSGELAGFGWGPLWHYSSSFERKLYKIECMSGRNPQRVIDHYHQEFLWRLEYQRIRQKQYRLHRAVQLRTRAREAKSAARAMVQE